VVDQVQFEIRQGRPEALGHFHVGVARSRVARRVIVHEDDPDSTNVYCAGYNRAQGAAKVPRCAFEQHAVIEVAPLPVEKQSMQSFHRGMLEESNHVAADRYVVQIEWPSDDVFVDSGQHGTVGGRYSGRDLLVSQMSFERPGRCGKDAPQGAIVVEQPSRGQASAFRIATDQSGKELSLRRCLTRC